MLTYIGKLKMTEKNTNDEFSNVLRIEWISTCCVIKSKTKALVKLHLRLEKGNDPVLAVISQN